MQFILIIIFAPQLIYNINKWMGMSTDVVGGVAGIQTGLMWTLSLGILMVLCLEF